MKSSHARATLILRTLPSSRKWTAERSVAYISRFGAACDAHLSAGPEAGQASRFSGLCGTAFQSCKCIRASAVPCLACAASTAIMGDPSFLADYDKELKRLTRNDKVPINVLTMLAEQREYAQGVVTLIENHIMQCPAPQKLPAMYLLDSIVKNLGGVYVTMFGRRLPEVFGSVWDSALQETRARLNKLLDLWKGHFPAEVLQQVKARIAAKAAAQPGMTRTAAAAAAGGAAGVPMHSYPAGAFIGYGLAGQPGLAVMATPAMAGYHAMPVGTAATTNGSITYGQPLQLPSGVAMKPQQVLVGYNMAGGMPQQQVLFQQVQLPPQPQLLLQQVPASGPPAFSSYQMGAPQSPGPLPLPSMLGQPGGAMYFPASSSAQQKLKRSPSPLQRPATKTQKGAATLEQMLGSLAAGGLLAPQVLPADDASLRITSFEPAFLKEFHPGVLQQLKALSLEVDKSLKDLEFHRKRRKAAGGAVSRQWYVPADAWIAGTVASTEAAVDVFAEEEAAAAAPAEVHLEPEDPSQPNCAISGEPFEKTYDDKTDEWLYRDAKRIYGADAERYGVPDGSIVKVKCLAEAPVLATAVGPSAAALEEEAPVVAADMATAAAEAPGALQEPQPVPAAAAAAGPMDTAAGGELGAGQAGVSSPGAVASFAAIKAEPVEDALAPPASPATAAVVDTGAPGTQDHPASPTAVGPDTQEAAAVQQQDMLQPAASPQATLPQQPAGGEVAPSSAGSKRSGAEALQEEATEAAAKRLKASAAAEV